MEIVIFKDLTTQDYINELKADAEKYTGLYVDMDKPEERKYVKDKAELINGLLKKVDRKRIDAAKEYKQAVEKEAASIVEDLKIANLPYTLLIDEWKAERKKILDAEKARKQAIIDAEKLEAEHEEALMMNRVWDLEKDAREAAKLKAKLELEEQIKEREAAAAEHARQQQIALQQEQEERERLARLAREADKKHKATINNKILSELIVAGLSESDSKIVIVMIAKGELSNVTINY